MMAAAAPSKLVGFIKMEIWRKHKIPILNQILCYKARCLKDFLTLKDYNMVDDFMQVWLIVKDAKFVVVD